MNADLGTPRELTGLKQRRALYQPELPPCLQRGAGVIVPGRRELKLRKAGRSRDAWAVHFAIEPKPKTELRKPACGRDCWRV
ncbi:hypothetical protein ACP70R_019013 [Stipagrostis hirtigluma subsp. patula]